MNVVLTIAGSDSGGGAGLQADLRTFAAHHLHGASAVTAVTAQNSVAVTAWVALSPEMVRAQIEAVATDMTVAASKTGMLATAAIVAAVAEAAARLPLGPLVVDPVMVAKSGDRLIDAAAERAYRDLLFPRATLVTPNLHEAAALLGRPVRDRGELRAAARDLQALGARAVLVKGGGLPSGDALDVFCDGDEPVDVAGPRLETRNLHGAGCTLSAAICSRLALGDGLLAAVRGAKAYLLEALRHSYAVGRGRGPLHHLYALDR
jgi:hydroxymethylpyrimidine/phosphomethylpyrimidine kinase